MHCCCSWWIKCGVCALRYIKVSWIVCVWANTRCMHGTHTHKYNIPRAQNIYGIKTSTAANYIIHITIINFRQESLLLLHLHARCRCSPHSLSLSAHTYIDNNRLKINWSWLLQRHAACYVAHNLIWLFWDKFIFQKRDFKFAISLPFVRKKMYIW